MDLRGKIALVTGASSGIGRQVAIDLTRNGARVILAARNKERLDEAVKAARGQPGMARTKKGQEEGTAVAIPADVTDLNQVAALKQAIGDRFGRLDLLVNCAGVAYFGTFEGMTPDQFDAVVKTNVYGIYNVTRAFIPLLKTSQGMVVNISSGLGARALPLLTVYSATKSAVNAISDGLRLELRPYGVSVLNFSPPEVETGFDAHTLHEAGGPEPDSLAVEGRAGRRKKARVEDVSRRLLQAIRKGERDVTMGGSLKAMNFYAPGMVDKMFSRMVEGYLKGRLQ